MSVVKNNYFLLLLFLMGCAHKNNIDCQSSCKLAIEKGVIFPDDTECNKNLEFFLFCKSDKYQFTIYDGKLLSIYNEDNEIYQNINNSHSIIVESFFSISVLDENYDSIFDYSKNKKGGVLSIYYDDAVYTDMGADTVYDVRMENTPTGKTKASILFNNSWTPVKGGCIIYKGKYQSVKYNSENKKFELTGNNAKCNGKL